MTKKKQNKPEALKDETLDRTTGGAGTAAWHELVILGDVAAAKGGAPSGGPHVKVFDGRSG